MLSVPKYDFNWQFNYGLEDPLFLPAGSRVIARGGQLGSGQGNPDPSRPVFFGLQTMHEMFFGFMTLDTSVTRQIGWLWVLRRLSPLSGQVASGRATGDADPWSQLGAAARTLRPRLFDLRGVLDQARVEAARSVITDALPEHERRIVAPAAMATHPNVIGLFQNNDIASIWLILWDPSHP